MHSHLTRAREVKPDPLDLPAASLGPRIGGSDAAILPENLAVMSALCADGFNQAFQFRPERLLALSNAPRIVQHLVTRRKSRLRGSGTLSFQFEQRIDCDLGLLKVRESYGRGGMPLQLDIGAIR